MEAILSKAGTLEANDMLWGKLVDKSRLILNRSRNLAEKLRQEQIISAQFCKYITDLAYQQIEIAPCNLGIIIESILIKLNPADEIRLYRDNKDLYQRIREYNKEVREFRFYTILGNFFFNPNKHFSGKARLVKI